MQYFSSLFVLTMFDPMAFGARLQKCDTLVAKFIEPNLVWKKGYLVL